MPALHWLSHSFFLSVGSWPGSGPAPSSSQHLALHSWLPPPALTSAWHLALLTLPKQKVQIKPAFLFLSSSETAISEGLRGGTEKRIVLSKPLHRGLKLVKSQVHL